MYRAALCAVMMTAAATALLAADPPADIFNEAESCTEHTFSGIGDFPDIVSGDKILRLWKGEDPGPEGYTAKFPFRIEAAGVYHVWLAASTSSTSPFWWRVDDGQWVHVDADSDIDMTSNFGVSGAMTWARLTDANLQPGEHALTIKVNERRTMLEKAYLLYLDALLITARDVQPDGLVRPADLPNLKPATHPEQVVPVKRAMPTGPPMVRGSSVGPTRQNRILASLGFKLLQTDSDHLTVNETEPGKWDWSGADAGLAQAQKVGAKWQYFPHFHWTTDWLMKTDKFVPSVGLATGRKLRAMSVWSPYLPEWFDHCYGALAAQYGGGSDKVAAIYLGIHGDFGEALYPLGFHPDEKTRFGEEGTGTADYWCGDEHARASFRDMARRKYRTLEKLNNAWGTRFARWEDVTYPPILQGSGDELTVPARRYWLDFIGWYHDSLTDFTAMVARAARKHFPQSRLVVPVGNGDEALVGGCDLTAVTKICRESRVDMRSTHGGYQPVPQNYASMLRRLASASHFYGVPFWSEPPGSITPDGEVGRFFEAISCRSTGYWDWGSNPVGARDVFRRYGSFLTHEQTVCDVALMFPTTDHRLRPKATYPPQLRALGATLRSTMDYDIIDERMIADGALANERVLVFADGRFFAPEFLAKLEAWVRAGGVMVRGNLPMMTVDEDASVWQRLSGVKDGTPAPGGAVEVAERRFLRYTARDASGEVAGITAVVPEVRVLAMAGGKPVVWARPLGKGWVIVCAFGPTNQELYRSVIRDVVYNLPQLDRTKQGAKEVAPGAAWSDLYTTLLKSGEVIAYNHGAKPITTAISGREVTVAPHALVSVGR